MGCTQLVLLCVSPSGARRIPLALYAFLLGDEGHNRSLVSLLLQAVFKFRNSSASMTFGALLRERFWQLWELDFFFSLIGFNTSSFPAESEPLKRPTVSHVVWNEILSSANRGRPSLQDRSSVILLKGCYVAWESSRSPDCKRELENTPLENTPPTSIGLERDACRGVAVNRRERSWRQRLLPRVMVLSVSRIAACWRFCAQESAHVGFLRGDFFFVDEKIGLFGSA